jgi:NAD(P)-dependent dehydrogenase (short-subunit alcohol dehydrogenase family)
MNTAVVLTTGALTGIGRATALAFAHEGARLVISGRRDDAGQALRKELCTSPAALKLNSFVPTSATKKKCAT